MAGAGRLRALMLSGLLVTAALLPASSLAQERVGVGINVGRISVDDPFATGESYRLPSLGVMNTGEIESEYALRVTYLHEQPELRPPESWFGFEPSRFSLPPGETLPVHVRVSVPRDADLGSYFAFIEAFPLTEDDSATVGAAAATRLEFTVERGEQAGQLREAWQQYRDAGPISYLLTAVVGLVTAGYLLRERLPLRVRIESRR